MCCCRRRLSTTGGTPSSPVPEIGTLGLTRRELETCPREPDCGPERKRRSIHRPPTGGAPALDPTDERRLGNGATAGSEAPALAKATGNRYPHPPTATAPVVDSTAASIEFEVCPTWTNCTVAFGSKDGVLMGDDLRLLMRKRSRALPYMFTPQPRPSFRCQTSKSPPTTASNLLSLSLESQSSRLESLNQMSDGTVSACTAVDPTSTKAASAATVRQHSRCPQQPPAARKSQPPSARDDRNGAANYL